MAEADELTDPDAERDRQRADEAVALARRLLETSVQLAGTTSDGDTTGWPG